MTHNKPSREEGLFPLPFLFFVLCRAVHNMLMLQQGAEYGRNCTKNNRRKETMPDKSNKESQKKAGESKARRF